MQEELAREGEFTVNKTPENDSPELIRQRLSTLVYLALRILAREGKLQSGLTEDQIRQIWEQRNPWLRYRDRTSENMDGLKTEEPVIREIRVRMPANIISQIDEQARKLHISCAELAKKWITEGLSQNH
jgi:hypothetical protein